MKPRRDTEDRRGLRRWAPAIAIALALVVPAAVLAAGKGVGFGPPASTPAGENLAKLATGDFDRDGDIDVAATDFDGDSDGVDERAARVFLNDGSGGLSVGPVIQTNDQPDGIVAARVDPGKDLDLVIGTLTGEVLLFKGAPGAVFGPPVPIDVGGEWPRGVAIADFTGDGRPDLAASRQDGGDVILAKQLADGSFDVIDDEAGGTNAAPMAVRFNSDKRRDLASLTPAGDVRTFVAGKKGLRRAVTRDAGPEPFAITSADLDRDRKQDLIVTNAGPAGGRNIVSVFRGRGRGRLGKRVPVRLPTPAQNLARGGPSGSFPVEARATDLNRDRRADLVVALRGESYAAVLRNKSKKGGPIRFAKGRRIAAGEGQEAIAVARLNGDRRPDLALAGGSSAVIRVLQD